MSDLSGGDAGTSTNDAAASDGFSDASIDASPSSDAGPDTSLSYAEEVLADAPLAYYRLDDTGEIMRDSTTNHLDGTYVSAMTGVPGLLGKSTMDTAANFPGADGGGSIVGAKVPRSPIFEVTNEISVEAWVRITELTDGEIASYGPQASMPYQPWVLQYGSLNGGVAYHEQFYGANLGFLTAQTNLVINTTYYFVGTFDGATMRVYLNAQVDGVLAANASMFSNYDGVTGLGIGGGPFGNDPAIAVIDEVAIYDHVLSLDRIAAHYAAGTK